VCECGGGGSTHSREYKCFTPFHPKPALGHGSQANGGAPSTADGWFAAFGNTLEGATAQVLGLAQRGLPGERPFNRATGVGFVAARPGDYADALAKHNPVTLFHTETSGAISPGGRRALALLARIVSKRGHHDPTTYGSNRSAPKGAAGYLAHHTAQISAAIVYADADAILGYADGRLEA
jgi:hypothetical protein